MFAKVLSILMMLLLIGCGGGGKSSETQNATNTNLSNSLSALKDNTPKIKITSEKVEEATIFYPENIAQKLPVILFIPGWSSINPNNYKTLIDALVLKKNIVLFAPEFEEYGCTNIIKIFEDMYQDCTKKAFFDTSRLGVVGHSSGGGKAFYVLKYFADKGWGKNGKFIFAMAPWYAFDMRKHDFDTFPKDTNIAIELFSHDSGTDLRVPFTIFSMLTNIDKKHKDFFIYDAPDAYHSYPSGNGSSTAKEGVLKPLESMISLTFFKNQTAYPNALENGSDTPWEYYKRYIHSKDSYQNFPCMPEAGTELFTSLIRSDINYCNILPF